MFQADGKFSAGLEGDVSFPWTVARDSHRGSALNSAHFITQTKIEDVSLMRQKEKKHQGLGELRFNSEHPVS